jgi:hypothetical protein
MNGNMQYKIPQNVQIEDKIVGPLTLKQLAILGGGGGVTYLIYTALATKYFVEVWIWFVLPPLLLTLAFTFLKINGIPFQRWIFLVVEYFVNPRKRVFMMGSADHYEASIFSQKTNEKAPILETASEDKARKIKNLDEISKVLDTYHKASTT